MKIRNFLTAVLCAAIMMPLCACGEGGNDGMLSEKNLKPLGRTYFSDGRIYCALSGTGVEFSCTGKSCTVTVEGDSSVSAGNIDNFSRVAIYLDGERVIDDMVYKMPETYTVFEGDSERTAEVRIIKLSESPMSNFAITSIDVPDGTVSPLPEKDRLIEFVGDSITCGYGVDDEDMNHHFSTRTEDVTKTYAFKTAETLNADWSMVSFSGYGIISGYSDGEKKVTEQALPQYYGSYGHTWAKNGDFSPQDTKWKFERQPDVVVINLGTNDDSYCKNIPERCEEFKTEYISFLKTVRKKNPDAAIICSLGIMGQNLYPYIEEAVSAYTEETGDENVSCLRFDNQSPEDGIAADWHPTERTHAKASAKLVEKIRRVTGWED